MSGAPLLDVRGVDFSYGSLQVLFGVSLEVHEGEVLALLGTNGSGKSTLLRVVSGLGAPSAGSVAYDGRDVTTATPADRVAGGLVQVAGGKAVFPDLTVAENLRLGGFLLRREPELLAARIDEVRALFPVLHDRRDQRAGTLSGGERQMLAIGKALLLHPRLLCIDELSLGLAPSVVGQLIEVIASLAARGMTVVIVEQSVNVAAALAERAVFLEKGHVRFEGPIADLVDRGDIVRAVFLGGAA